MSDEQGPKQADDPVSARLWARSDTRQFCLLYHGPHLTSRMRKAFLDGLQAGQRLAEHGGCVQEIPPPK
jgi:hypothetical protein